MIRFSTIALILTLIFSCQSERKSTIEPEHAVQNEDCLSKAEGYFERFGYRISNYFIVSSHKSYDLNNDGISDSIAILTPLELAPRNPFCERKENGVVEDRLLVINLMERDGSIAKKQLYDKVISNEKSWAAMKLEESIIEKETYPGLVLSQNYGQGCYGKYFIYVRHHEKHDFVVDSLVYKTKCPRDTQETVRRQELPKSPLPLEEYNREYLVPFKKEHGIIK